MRNQNRHTKKSKIFTKKILVYFLTSRIIIFFLGYLSSLVVTKGPWFVEPKSFFWLFYHWDSGWYLSIINKGYYYIQGAESNVAFYPVYPHIVKLFSHISHIDPLVIGIFVSNVALLFAAIYLYKLIRIDFNEKIALASTFFLLISPMCFFFSVFYTEGLFLFLAIATIYYARKEKWAPAGVLGFLLSATRGIGFLIFIPVLIEYIYTTRAQKKLTIKWIKNFSYVLAIPFGLATYGLYLYIKFNDTLAFAHAQVGWNRHLGSIATTVFSINLYPLFYKIFFVGTVCVAIFFIACLIYYKVRASYIVYSVAVLIMCLSSGLLESTPRYISTIFPIYLGMALWVSKSKILEAILAVLSVLLLILFTTLFVNGYWMT